jgi:L-amino acid N-acyltransferase YncA
VKNLAVRAATAVDAKAITAIYAEHVRTGTASFDTIPRSEAQSADLIEKCRKHGWPFLVAELDGAVVGYAYATQFRDRPAYANTCENSIYVHHDLLGKGIGKTLLERLILDATRCGFRQMIAVVGAGAPASVGLHKSLGFGEAGRMQSVGRKFETWLDTVYLQRSLGPGNSTPPEREP